MPDEPQFLNPSRLVKSLEIPKGSVAADFGAGSGFYAVPLADAVGPEGKVYAFDIMPEALSRLRSLARMRHLLNIEPVIADLEVERGTHLKDSVADFVLIASVLHQATDKPAVLKEARRILKHGRTLIIVEWDESKSPGGPSLESRVPKSKARELSEAAGFQSDREIPAGSHHYCLLFRRS